MEIGKIGGAICLSVLFGAQSVEGIHVGLTVEQTCEDQKSRPSTWKLKISESIKTVKLDETARGPSSAPDDRRAPQKPGEPIGSKDLRRKDWCCQGIRMRTKNSAGCDGMHLFTIKIDKLEGKDFSKIQGSQSSGCVPAWLETPRPHSDLLYHALPGQTFGILLFCTKRNFHSHLGQVAEHMGVGGGDTVCYLLFIQFWLKNFLSFFVWEFRLQVCLYAVCVQYPQRPGEGNRSLGIRVSGVCELPCGCLNLKKIPQNDQPVLFLLSLLSSTPPPRPLLFLRQDCALWPGYLIHDPWSFCLSLMSIGIIVKSYSTWLF